MSIEKALKRAKRADKILNTIMYPFLFIIVHVVMPYIYPASILAVVSINLYGQFESIHLIWIIPLWIALEAGGLWLHWAQEGDPRVPSSHL